MWRGRCNGVRGRTQVCAYVGVPQTKCRRLSCLALLLSCSLWRCGNLDTIDAVHDLRLLAVQAEPPDQPLVMIEAPAGMTPIDQATRPVTLTALVADPTGAGRPIAYALSTCARLDPNTRSCRVTSPGFADLSAGVTAASEGYIELVLPFVASESLIAQAVAQDPYHGAFGLWVPVQLTLTAGEDRVVGTKLVVYSMPQKDGTYALNQNPSLTGLSVDGAAWPSDAPYPYSVATAPKDGFVLAPLYDAALQTDYPQMTFGGSVRTLHEAWLFDYFNTWGGMTPPNAGGTSVAAATATPTTSAFVPPKGASFGPGLFFVVVRDGRGGTSWLVRRATLAP